VPESVQMWMEILFNIGYLVVIWGLVVAMTRNQDRVGQENKPVAHRIRQMFFLLALGDTGHVGFRVIAYALGGLESRPVVLGVPLSLVGLGALATAVTVTLFYVLALDAWRLRNNKTFGAFEYFLLAMAVVRFAVMALPGNQWDSVVPPQPMGILRNLPLIVLGLGGMMLILRDARREGDRLFLGIGMSILVSFAFYTPVILFVQQAPMLGMLMIPKTLAYVAIAALAYRGLYLPEQPSAVQAELGPS
jgi:hypothetical protein